MKKALFVCVHNGDRSQMAESFLDASGSRSEADLIITVGTAVDEACPAAFFPAEDWGPDDPAGRSMTTVRRIRDQIRARVAELLEQEG